MNKFYQIVTKQEIDGYWLYFFVENSEIYQTYEEAYQKALDLANEHTNELFNSHLEIKQYTEDNKPIIRIFNPRIDEIEREYHIKELTVI